MNRAVPALVFALVAVGAMTASEQAIAQDHIHWRSDIEQAKKLAAEENKLVLLHFTATWCAPCKEIERFVFVNPMAIRAIGTQVVPVKMDVDLNQDVAAEYNVTSVPHDVIVTPAGHVVSERSSPRSSDGYLQMIQHAKTTAASLSNEVIQEVAGLKKEYRRLNKQRQAERSAEKSFGTVAQSATSQFKSNYKTHPAAQIPKFQGPASWSASETPVKPATTVEQMIAQTGVQRGGGSFRTAGPVIPAQPSHNAPREPLSPSTSVGGGFMPGGNHAPAAASPELLQPQKVVNQFVAESRDVKDEPVTILNPMAIRKAEQPASESTASAAIPQPATTAPLLGLEGYCGVTLIEGQRWIKGNQKWGCIHRGRLYLFASEAKREQFRESPDMYSPLLGGSDPVEFHAEGTLVPGLRKHGVFYGDDGGPAIIVLFRNLENRAKFEAEASDYLQTVRQATSHLDNELLTR